MELLAKLFGSVARVKVLRLVLFNKEQMFAIGEVVTRTKIRKDTARKELELLTKIGILKKHKIRGKREAGYKVDTSYEHYESLRAFVRRTTEIKKAEVTKTLRRCGTVRLLVLSGALTDTTESSLDLLIVGDKLNQQKIDRAIRSLEAELGQELSYATFSTSEFNYRRSVYDRLLRDVLEYPKIVLIDVIGVTK